MLRTFAPFNAWRLPPASRVRFVTVPSSLIGGQLRERKTWGLHWTHEGRHTVYIAPHRHLDAMVRTMGHEMIHMHEFINDVPCAKRGGAYLHGAEFQAIADTVCSTLGLTRKNF